MKAKSILLAVLLISMLTSKSIAQNVPSYVPTNGLVGWWPFNGNANDESGNGNNGVVYGATLSNDRFGTNNTSYSFNGSGNYIGLSSTNLPTASRTVSVWFYANTLTGGPAILGYGGNGCGNSFFIAINQPPIPNKIINQGHCINDSLTTSYTSDPTNAWYHLVITSDTSGTKHYINGKLTSSNSTSIINTYTLNRSFAVGTNVNPYGSIPYVDVNQTWWNGSLDDLGIWNRALSQQEITNLFNGSLPPSCPAFPSNLQTGLIGYWPFCGNSNDESGNGNNGTVNGATLTMDRFGDSNKSYNFNGSSNIYKSNFIFPGGNYTVSFWFMLNDTTVTQRLVTQDWQNGGTFSFGFIRDIFGTKSIEGIHNRDDGSPTGNKVQFHTNPSTETWNFCTFIAEGNKLKMFYNGNYVDSSICNIPIPSNQTLFLGGDTFHPLIGKLDDITIWNRALSINEANQLYKATAAPGNFGINVENPQYNLHIRDVMKLEPRTSPPANPTKGVIYFDETLNKLRVYDGTAWQNCW